MANEKQLEVLKKGVEVWNSWKSQFFEASFDFSGANLEGENLRNVNFYYVNLIRANLSKADLSKALLCFSDFREADLSNSNLWLANFISADLRRVNFSGANLEMANLHGAYLRGANFSGAKFSYTTIAKSDLSETIGLESVVHRSPSSIDIETVRRSKGRIPEVFLRGCGLSDLEIEFAKLSISELSNEELIKTQYRIHDLLTSQAIQIFPLFISYCHADSLFVDKLEIFLNKRGIRFWRDIHEMKSGRMERQIDRAIRLNPTVLLILSKDSLQSDWVEHEVRSARALEKEMKRDVLCPVALDDSWKNSPWAKRIMEQIMEYNILDFSEWKDDAKFESTFNKLINGLGLFYK